MSSSSSEKDGRHRGFCTRKKADTNINKLFSWFCCVNVAVGGAVRDLMPAGVHEGVETSGGSMWSVQTDPSGDVVDYFHVRAVFKRRSTLWEDLPHDHAYIKTRPNQRTNSRTFHVSLLLVPTTLTIGPHVGAAAVLVEVQNFRWRPLHWEFGPTGAGVLVVQDVPEK